MTDEGQYIYAVVATDDEKNLGFGGIGNSGGEVSIVCYQDIGAVISPSPIVKHAVTRTNTMTHQKIMEELMQYYPLLPVRFGTIAERIDMVKETLLKSRYQELKENLMYVGDKVELGLKALWMDMATVFQEIVEENMDIKRMKERLMSRRTKMQRDQVRLGELVKKALEKKKKREEGKILKVLEDIWTDYKINNAFGDQMVTNSAFLVEKDREKAFDDAMERLMDEYKDRIRFKYVGPVPPCNFVEIEVAW